MFSWNYFKDKHYFTQRYKSKSKENAFKLSIVNIRTLQMRYISFITTLIYMIYVIMDFYLANESMLLNAVLFHSSMIILLGLCAILIHYKYTINFLYFAPIYASFFSALLIVNGMPFYLGDIHVIFLWAFVVVGFRFFEAFLVALIMLSLHIGVFLFFETVFSIEVLINHIFLTLVSFILGFMSGYLIELYTRSNFETFLTLESSNRRIKEGIEYASLIQNAILPPESIIEKFTKEHFIFWQPKDIVGGDIYFSVEIKEQDLSIFMVIDGAGHGVPGAFVTMLVKAIENQISAEIEAGTLKADPALILAYFNHSIKTMLKQEKGSKSNAGFDGGVLCYQHKTKECHYAGAKTPLYIVSEGKLRIIPGDKKNVGFIRTKIDQEYTSYKLDIKEGDYLYLSTDGFMDQEGNDDKRYGKKAFERLILKIYTKEMEEQKECMIKAFEIFKSEFDQSDDITVVGLKF